MNKENRIILFFLFVAICAPIIQDLLKGIGFNELSVFVSYIDELFVVFLFIYTLFTKGIHHQKVITYAIIALYMVGLVSGGNSVFSWKVNILGAFNNLKSFLIFVCLSQYKFEMSDFKKFGYYFICFFPIIFLSYLIELFIPTFRSSVFDFGNQGLAYRRGFRCMGGIFPRYTHASLWGLVMYVLYSVYYTYEKKNFKRWFCLYMIVATIKVKDIIAVIMTFTIQKFSKINLVYVVIVGFLGIISMDVYEYLYPEHYALYFGEGADDSIRNIMNVTSIEIAFDYFPLGVGWGKFGSATSAQFYSEIYNKYGIEGLWGLNYESNHSFMQDNQFPMFLGETGFLGTFLFLFIVFKVFTPFLIGFFKKTSDPNYAMPACLFIYFIVCVMGKPVFVAVPHSFVIWGIAGMFYSIIKKQEKVYENT